MWIYYLGSTAGNLFGLEEYWVEPFINQIKNSKLLANFKDFSVIHILILFSCWLLKVTLNCLYVVNKKEILKVFTPAMFRRSIPIPWWLTGSYSFSRRSQRVPIITWVGSLSTRPVPSINITTAITYTNIRWSGQRRTRY